MEAPSVGSVQTDDLDSLIADSLGGVQAALDSDKKVVAPAPAARNAGEALRELQQGPGRTADGEEFFANLVKTFQDENFQKTMADAMQGIDPEGAAKLPGEAAEDKGGYAAGAVVASSSSAPAASEAKSESSKPEDFLQNFLSSFDAATGADPNFEKQLTGLMTSMISSDLIVEPMQQIVDSLEPWLKSKKGLAKADRTRYEAQLRLYKQIVGLYKQNPDPLPDSAREQVQKLLNELHTLGQPPDEVMSQITPKDAEEGGESLEDFMKQMGLDQNLGTAEQELLEKLQDPEELTKVMKDMAGEEACKQQ